MAATTNTPPTQPAQLPDLRPPTLPPLDETLARLGHQEPLPPPDPSHWEEPVKLAVQLVRDPLPWLQALAPQNLALAGRAAVACRQKAEALPHGRAVLDDLRQALLPRSRDPAVDVRLRIEAGLVLGELGDTGVTCGRGSGCGLRAASTASAMTVRRMTSRNPKSK